VNKNETIDLYINAATTYDLEVFRMGWYPNPGPRPAGARKVWVQSQMPAQTQIPCATDTDAGFVECHWGNPPGKPTTSLSPALFDSPYPDGPVSGYYLVRLSSPSSNAPTAQSFIIFVIRDDNRGATFLMNAAMTTYQAYNEWGAYSLYTNLGPPGCCLPGTYCCTLPTQVSFDRPYNYGHGTGYFFDENPTRYNVADERPESWPTVGFEYPMVRFLEREGYDVTYATDVDLHAKPNLLTNPLYPRNAFLSVGHDEYWSTSMHDNLEVARDAGKHVAFFSGNSVYWIINFHANNPLPQEPLRDNRIIETHKASQPPEDPNPWLWQNCANPPVPPGRYNAPRCSTAEQSEQMLVGSITTDGWFDRGDFVFTAPDLGSWVLQGAGLQDGSRLPGMIGYEAQTVRNDRASPPGQTILADSQFRAGPKNLFADMSLYQAKGNAWVFSTGSTDWSLGLDIYATDFLSTPYLRLHPAIVHITRKVLAQFGDPRPVADIGTAYSVSIQSIKGGTVSVLYTTIVGRPSTDFVVLHDVTQDDQVLIDYGPKCFIPPNSTQGMCSFPTPPAGTYTADYVTLDKRWQWSQDLLIRTIWRGAKSAQFTIPP